jgi:type II secretory pathway component GspD/PulD (secretin)
LQFDKTPALDALKASLALVGVPAPIKVCGPAGNITGTLTFVGPVDLAQGLRQLGGDVVFAPGQFLVGCTPKQVKPDARPPITEPSQLVGIMPGSNIPTGNPLEPSQGGSGYVGGGEPAVEPVAPPEPPKTEIVRSRYTVGKRLTDMLAKVPGLAVVAEADRVGPVAFTGPEESVAEALKLFKAIDQCPTKIEVQASILVKQSSLSASRGFGVQLRLGGNDFVLGGQATGSGVSIDIPALSAFIAAAKDRSGLVQLSSLGGEVNEGDELELNDGGEVPIRGETIITDRDTRPSVSYRKTGHTLKVRVLSAGEFIVGELTHELSTVGTQTELGPTFGSRSTKTTFRLRPFEPLALSLSGLDGGREEKRRGILSSSKSSSRQTDSAVLVLAMRPLTCDLEADGVEGGVKRLTLGQLP